MDIRNNKMSVKRFALKATASAILSLYAEITVAGSCPAYITSSSGLAGMICDFDVGSSVTVVNGGIVGQINMSGYTPTPPSSLTINTGGTISSSTGVAINISASELSSGLSNSGTVSSTSHTGITIINHSTISGGIVNNGLISAHDTVLDIEDHSHIKDGIFNRGSIISNVEGTAIRIYDNSTVSGGIFNSGTIISSAHDVAIGVLITSTVDGGITNSGLIEAAGDGDGILIHENSRVSGGIVNSNIIRSVGHNGISINISNLDGNLSNSGTISGNISGVAIHNGSNVSGHIQNSGVMSGETGLNVFSSTTITGGISNSGSIIGNDVGLAITTNAIVTGNISNSGTIQGSNFAIKITDSNVGHIDILGQSARVIGAVEAHNTTVNIKSGAIFTSEGTYDVDNFKIEENALFNMRGRITANEVSNSGTLAIADPIQTIIGNYVQHSGGLFQTEVASTADYGQLSVQGVIDLSESGDIYVLVDPNSSIHNGDVFFNVMNGDTLITPNNGFNVSDSSFIWSFIPSLNNTNTGVNLTAAVNPNAYNVCQGTYCQGAANTIVGQVAAGNPIFGPYEALPTANALRIAASQATPELTNENIQVTQLITRSVMDVVPMWDSLHGKPAGDAMLFQPGKIWVKPYGGSMTQNERSTVEGFNATVYGAVIGKDIPLNDDWLVGGAFAAGGDNMRGKSVLHTQSIDSNAYQGMLYGAKKFPNHIYVAGQGLVGYENNHTNRVIPLYASIAKGSYNSWFTNLRAEAGWSKALGPNFVFTPEVDASYLYVNQGSYREFGSLMDLAVASNNNSSLVLGAYGNGAYHLLTMNTQHDLTLTGYAGIAGDVIHSQPQVTSTFVAGGAGFSTFGVQFNGAVFRGGVGLALTNKTNPFIFELNYDLQAGNNAYSGVGAATIKYRK